MTARVGWWVAVLLVLGCSSKSNPTFCDEVTTCPGQDQVCDLAVHECIDDPSVVACEDGDPSDCPNGEPFCTDGHCSGCTSALGCEGTTPICEISVGECRGCDDAQDCVEQLGLPVCAEDGQCVSCTPEAGCEGATPVCDEGSCRACLSDTDCDVLCDEPTGSCAGADEVIFFDPAAATGSTTCTREAPCTDLLDLQAHILPATRWIVMREGIFQRRDVTLTLDHPVTIEGMGATFGRITLAAGSLSIQGGTLDDKFTCGTASTTATVTIADVLAIGQLDLVNCEAELLRIDVDGTGKDSGLAIAAPSTVTMFGSTVHHGNDSAASVYGILDATDSTFMLSQGDGISIGGEVRLHGGRVTSNGEYGVFLGLKSLSFPMLQMERVFVGDNDNTGLRLRYGNYNIENSYVVENGRTTGPGGVIFENATGSFRFNTVAGNRRVIEGCGRGDLNCVMYPAIKCNDSQRLENSIAPISGYAMVGTAPASGCQGTPAASCNPDYVDDDPATGTVDYHLGPATTCRNKAEGTPPATDYDGEARPRGAGTEIGADEIE